MRTKMLAVLVAMPLALVHAVEGDPQVATPQLPGPPPEVAKTVSAVLGTWTGQMTATIPGEEPESFSWTMECREVALGAGASCTMGGRASIGPIAEACIMAWHPDGEVVHKMCVTSMGEIHDHRGRWTDDGILEFEPLEGTLMGQPMTEIVTMSFPDPRSLENTSVITVVDGPVMTFEFVGKRDDDPSLEPPKGGAK